MADREKHEADFDRGYNDGYLMREFAPEVARELIKIEADSPFLAGIKAGAKTFDIERSGRAKENTPSWLDREVSREFNEKSQRKDKGIEPER